MRGIHTVRTTTTTYTAAHTHHTAESHTHTHTHSRAPHTHTHSRAPRTHTAARRTHTHTHTQHRVVHTQARAAHTHSSASHTQPCVAHTQPRAAHTHTAARHTHTAVRIAHTQPRDTHTERRHTARTNRHPLTQPHTYTHTPTQTPTSPLSLPPSHGLHFSTRHKIFLVGFVILQLTFKSFDVFVFFNFSEQDPEGLGRLRVFIFHFLFFAHCFFIFPDGVQGFGPTLKNLSESFLNLLASLHLVLGFFFCVDFTRLNCCTQTHFPSAVGHELVDPKRRTRSFMENGFMLTAVGHISIQLSSLRKSKSFNRALVISVST